jgi:hypothetical protein
MIRAFARFYFKPSLANWRALRRVCMAKLPPQLNTKEPSNANG